MGSEGSSMRAETHGKHIQECRSRLATQNATRTNLTTTNDDCYNPQNQ